MYILTKYFINVLKLVDEAICRLYAIDWTIIKHNKNQALIGLWNTLYTKYINLIKKKLKIKMVKCSKMTNMFWNYQIFLIEKKKQKTALNKVWHKNKIKMLWKNIKENK